MYLLSSTANEKQIHLGIFHPMRCLRDNYTYKKYSRINLFNRDSKETDNESFVKLLLMQVSETNTNTYCIKSKLAISVYKWSLRPSWKVIEGHNILHKTISDI